jgi:choline dehydrogenase-like flavoprotein
MMIDARRVARNSVVQADICVIGAGAAGITLARELAGQSMRVCLLESGGLEPDQETQSLAVGENVGLPYYPLEAIRPRYFGGATNLWQGMCRPLDDADFDARPWVANSGWPFKRSELEPYYTRAQKICQLGPFRYEEADWAGSRRPVLDVRGTNLRHAIFQFGPPTRFGQVYRQEVLDAANVHTYLHANVAKLETTRTGEAVRAARIACVDGNQFSLTAKQFVLATGGIENARLLLLSNDVHTTGLGNQHDLVGRFFAEHPLIKSGLIMPASANAQMGLYRLSPESGFGVKALMAIDAETQRQERIAGYSTALDPTDTESVGVGSAKRLYLDMRQGKIPKQFFWHLRNVVMNIDDVASVAYRELMKTPVQLYSLDNRIEPVPNRSSRVTLSDRRDALGLPRVKLEWRLADEDLQTLIRGQELMARELGKKSLGRVKMEIDSKAGWPVSAIHGGYHHMGTTRMHESPRLGVVDASCRVHGVHNLFIAGSSVFPTYGYANPTLTIVALAVRLAEHLKRTVGSA